MVWMGQSPVMSRNDPKFRSIRVIRNDPLGPLALFLRDQEPFNLLGT